MKDPAVEQNDEPFPGYISDEEWADSEPVILAIREFRQKRLAEFNNDWERHSAALDVIGWACAAKVVSYDWRDPHGPREVELPSDLTGLIPNRDDFIRSVRLRRLVKAKREPDLGAYNEDARRRALKLGFPAETFVITAAEIQVSEEKCQRLEEKYARELAEINLSLKIRP